MLLQKLSNKGLACVQPPLCTQANKGPPYTQAHEKYRVRGAREGGKHRGGKEFLSPLHVSLPRAPRMQAHSRPQSRLALLTAGGWAQGPGHSLPGLNVTK